MGAEIFDVSITLGNGNPEDTDTNSHEIMYATKCEFKRFKDNNTTLTFNGDVNTGAQNSGATISFENLVFPESVEEAQNLEDMLVDGRVDFIIVSGQSYTTKGDSYVRTIQGNRCIITSDDESWAPSDGVSQSLELKVDELVKVME